MKDVTVEMAEETRTCDEQPSVIDWSVLDSLKALQRPGKPDLRKQLMSVYLDSAPALMNNIQAAVRAADGQALGFAAHALKSSSVSIGAQALGKTCSELELLGKANSLERAAELVLRAGLEFEAVCSGFRSALERNE